MMINLRELPIINTYRRCSVCRGIEVEDRVILSGENYDEQFFRRLGTDFTDGYLSRECWRGYLPIEGYEEIYNTLERETCREP